MYVDANNLYVLAMSKYLPCSEFKWLIQNEIDTFDTSLINENTSDRYVLEVDLQSRDELHELHNDYPLAPEKLEGSHNMLSKY